MCASELQAQGATRLVLDLRGNGGGVLDGAVGISGFFSEKPLVLRIALAGATLVCPPPRARPIAVGREQRTAWAHLKAIRFASRSNK